MGERKVFGWGTKQSLSRECNTHELAALGYYLCNEGEELITNSVADVVLVIVIVANDLLANE
jgi:hypothetical protein